MHTLALWLFPLPSSDASQKEPPPLDQHEFSPPTSRAPEAPEACRTPSSTFRARKVVDSCGSSVGFAADQTGNGIQALPVPSRATLGESFDFLGHSIIAGEVG